MFNPHDADNLTNAVIQSLQGDTSSMATLVSQTTTLTETFAGRDQDLGKMITNLNKVVGNLAAQNDNLDGVITQTGDMVAELNRRRPELVSSAGSLARVLGQLSASAVDVYPAAREFMDRQPGATRHILSVEPQVAFFADNVPIMMKGIIRAGNQGAFGNGYVCDVNLFGFFPGLNDVVPIIVNAATPGNKAMHTRGAGTRPMADSSQRLGLKRLKRRPLESYNKTWLGFIAAAVVAAVIGGMLVVHVLGAGYRHYTAEFVQAASLRPGHPIMLAGIPVGDVTSMKLDGDHVEAGLKIRDDIVLGKDSKAVIKLATILGGRYIALEPDGPGRLPHDTFELTHTEVPYDLQAALKDATTTFEQVDADRFAQSLTVLGTQIKGLPDLVPQALSNIDALSSIIAQRRDQMGELLKNSERVTNTLRSQQSRIGNLINQSQELIGVFVARRAVFHAMMQSLQSLADVLGKIAINDRPALDALIADMRDVTGLMGQHNDLMRNMLQASPILMREAANITGDGNAIVGNGPGGAIIDSWLCAISGRAKQFGMIQYFKDCK